MHGGWQTGGGRAEQPRLSQRHRAWQQHRSHPVGPSPSPINPLLNKQARPLIQPIAEENIFPASSLFHSTGYAFASPTQQADKATPGLPPSPQRLHPQSPLPAHSTRSGDGADGWWAASAADLSGSPVALVQEDRSVSGLLHGCMVSDGRCESRCSLGFARHGQNVLLLRWWGSMVGWGGSGWDEAAA